MDIDFICTELTRLETRAALPKETRHQATDLRVAIQTQNGLIYTRARHGETVYHPDREEVVKKLVKAATRFIAASNGGKPLSKTTTKDLGVFIRDMIEDRDPFTLFTWEEEEVSETGETDAITAVDASNASNLLVACESGAVFSVTVKRIA